MSMLAERKVKQKWSLNPRGKHWTDDQNKFGQKMLEKMGWSNGKGLGAREDGILEHVKVNYKNDSKGMGFKERDDQWTEHEDQFSTLLNSLSSSDNKITRNEKGPTSLVEKSKNSKARIHYKKFTKGKDISQYSEKDLANVFGRKHLNKKQTEETEESTTPETESSDPKHGVKTIMGGSMTDYFKKKLAKAQLPNKSAYTVGANGVLTKESDNEEEQPSFGFGFQSANQQDLDGRAGFGFSGFQISTPQKDTLTENGERDVLPSSKKKKKKNANTSEDDLQNGNPCEMEITACEENVETESLRKKKKKKSKRGECEDVSLNEFKTQTNEDDISVEENVITPKKKCKKKRTDEDSDLKTPTFVSYISEASVEELNNTNAKKRKLEEFEEKSPKKKKKSKDVGMTNPAFDPVFHPPPMEKHHFNTITEADDEKADVSEAVAKSKKKKKLSVDLDEIQVVADDENDESNLNESISKKNKKKKKDKVVDEEISSMEETVESSTKKKIKKRKLAEVDTGVENACFNGLDDSQIAEEVADNPYEVVKKKKKKSKNKNKDESLDQAETPKKKPKLDVASGIDNPALNLTTIDDITCDMILNTTIETPKMSKQRRKSVTFSNVNKEHIIPNREELARQNELFDINTKVLEESTKRREKNKGLASFDNRGFNMRSNGSEVYNKKLETRVPDYLKAGKTNKGFTDVQECAIKIRIEMDNYQSQVENELNEAKSIMVGNPGKGLDEPKVVDDGVILPFKKATCFGINYRYYPVNMTPKGSYKHLIKGDIMLYFKNANIHLIKGYGTLMT